METQMTDFLLNYSTADFEKTISVEDNPAYTKNTILPVFFPPGEYRLIAGDWKRIMERPSMAPTEERPIQAVPGIP